jgi:HEAT repeat protein
MGAEQQIAFFVRELSAPDPARRAAAAKGLGRIGQAEHAPVLAEAARDPEPVVRAAAAIGIGRLGRPGDVLIALMEDADPRVRRQASAAADRLALTGPAATEVFGRLLRDEDRHVRLNALFCLLRLTAPGDPVALVGLLGDPSPSVWGHARSLVWKLMDDDTVLAEVLRTARQGPGTARARVLDMLPARYTAQLRDSLLTGLSDPSPEVRKAVVDRLADDPASAGALLTALEEEHDPDVALSLVRALGLLGEDRALPFVVRWLDHPWVGPSAVRGLAGIGTPAAVRRIRAALTQWPRHPQVRAAAAAALGELGDRVDRLLPLIRDPDKRVRAGALDGLRALADHRRPVRERRRVAEALADRLAADPELVWYARNALSGYPEALPRVRRLADEAAGEVRAAALSLLDGADVQRFLTYLDDPDEPVRYHAALGLGRYLRDHGALPPGREDTADRLIALTADDSLRTRRAATEALDALGR